MCSTYASPDRRQIPERRKRRCSRCGVRLVRCKSKGNVEKVTVAPRVARHLGGRSLRGGYVCISANVMMAQLCVKLSIPPPSPFVRRLRSISSAGVLQSCEFGVV
ncbi:hypothetical protein EVAR_24833_1 [Eumeta japonica]|uniref:Uncharacterized protein n=1 Tax=Eumeta variegata TaxID=151549 RepID=A0A4C1W0U3_EUMVA|nr:hypothetical protein EVAR_24833_1 [Eumeta japonica]